MSKPNQSGPSKNTRGKHAQNQNQEEIKKLIAEGIKNAVPSIIQALRENEPSTHNKPNT
jgi:uncharacterized protein YoaH (UPF0181 family)